MLNPGQLPAQNALGTMFSTPSLTPLAQPPISSPNPTSTKRSAYAALAGTALGTVALTAPSSAFAADPCANTELAVKDTYAAETWLGANPGLKELVCQSPRPVETKIGHDSFDLFAPIKSPGATVDFISSSILQTERPVGEVRDYATTVTAFLGLALAMRMIYKDYTKLVNLPGLDDPADSIKWAAYINGLTALGRLGTDAWIMYSLGAELSAGNVNIDVLYSYFTVWAAMAGIWAMVAKFSTSLAGRFISFTNQFNRSFMTALPFGVYALAGYDQLLIPAAAASLGIGAYMYGIADASQGKKTVFNEPTISSGGLKQTTGRQVSDFIRSLFVDKSTKVGDQTQVNRTFDFNVDAEKIVHDYNANPSLSLASLDAKVGFSIVGTSNFETILPQLKQFQEDNRSRLINTKLSITGTRTEVLKKTLVQPGEGEIVAGSTIRTKNGTKYLQQNMPVTEQTGSVFVVSGKLKIVEQYDLDHLQQSELRVGSEEKGSVIRYGAIHNGFKGELPDEIVYAVSISGSADHIIPSVANLVALRDLSDDLIPWVNQTPNGLRRVTSRLVLRAFPDKVRHLLRDWFVPNNLSVSLSVPQEQFADVVNDKTLASLETLAVQNRWIGTLKQNPTIPLGVTQVDWLSSKGKKEKLTIRLPETVESKSVISAILARAENRKLTEGFLSTTVELTLRTEDVALLANALKGDRKTSKQIRIVLDTPVVAANGLASLTEIEKIAGEVGAGSEMSYADYLDRPKMSLLQGAQMLTNTALPGLSYGRFGVIAGLILSGAWMSFPLTSGTKYLQGFEDPAVYITSGKRIFLTSSLNRIFGPTIIAMVQESGYSGYKFYMPGMTTLTLWEVFNETKEADVTLYKQKLRRILGEDRIERRIEMARDVQEYERLVETSRPEHRSKVIAARLMNFMSTGVSTERDADILVELYRSGAGDSGFEVDFLLALMADDAFMSSVVSNAEAKAFFAAQISPRMSEIERRADELGLGEAIEVLQ